MNGILYCVTSTIASGQTIAAGTNVVATTIRNNRDQLAFYGLASIAGDTTQAQSNNAAGIYTEDAARAIRKMLGVDETPELIADVTTEEDLTTITINKVAGQSLMVYEFESHNGLYFNRGSSAADFGGSGNNIISNNVDGFITDVYSFKLNQYRSTTTLIPSGTRIKIYGVRI